MFAKHVIKDLSAYCHGELSAHEASELAEHLIGCSTCRAAFEEIKFGVRLAEHVPAFKAPETSWEELEAQLDTHLGPEMARSMRSIPTFGRTEHATLF